LTHPVRLSALAALDIQQAREWHDAQEPGLGDQFLQRVNETMTRIGQNPHQYPDDHRRRSKGQPSPVQIRRLVSREGGRLRCRGLPAPSAAA
jgi:hypothetical protein